jgi:hypothetical protein
MFVVEAIGYRNVPFVPALPVIGLIASDKDDRMAAWIKGEQSPQMTAD